MTPITPKLRQLVDWRAAAWAGLIAGGVFLLLNVFVAPLFLGASPWMMVRLTASILLGEGILAPPATLHYGALLAAVLSNTVLCLGFALFVAYVLHRGGLVMGIAGGAALGLALYGISFYTLTLFYPWFFAFRGWGMMVHHVLLGMLSGVIYEWLEVERFVPVEANKERGSGSCV